MSFSWHPSNTYRFRQSWNKKEIMGTPGYFRAKGAKLSYPDQHRKGEIGACDKDRSKCVHHLLEIFTHSTNSVNQECVMIHTSEFFSEFPLAYTGLVLPNFPPVMV